MFHPTTTGFPLSLPRTRCALAAALVCFSYCGSSAYAQTPEPTQTQERVTVTGSTIKRLDRETAERQGPVLSLKACKLWYRVHDNGANS